MTKNQLVTRFLKSVAPLLLSFISVLILCSTALFFSGCVSSSPEQRIDGRIEETEDPRLLSWDILDYQYKNRDGIIPLWVSSYLMGGNQAVERLQVYEDYYIFVSQNTGTNFSALEQWKAAFNPELDFARLVAVRIEKRFLAAAQSYPDYEYGPYFEALIRLASDSVWEGALRDDEFWLLREFPEADGFMVMPEMYDFLILVKIEKSLLASQIRTLFQNVEPLTPLSRDQNTAVQRVQEHFFENF
jgi:hypothetical protein